MYRCKIVVSLLLLVLIFGCKPSTTDTPGSDSESSSGHGPTVATDDSNFGVVVLQADKPVLVDFWAEWCGPCKMIAPIVSELAADFEGQVIVAKVDVDRAQHTAQQYNIDSIPTLVLFRGGKELTRIVGLTDKASLAELLSGAL